MIEKEYREAEYFEAKKNNSKLESIQHVDRLWSPLFVCIIICALCTFMTGQGLNSGTSVFLERMGESATLAGVLAAVFSIAAAIARIACGPIIDGIGRVVVMATGVVILIIGTSIPILLYSPTIFTICRILQGIGFSAATTAVATMAADVIPRSRLGEGIGYYGLGQALAMSIGPALAIFLVNTQPATNLYLGLTAVATLGFILTFICHYENKPQRLPKTAEYRIRLEAGDLDKKKKNEDEEQGSGLSKFVYTFFEPKALPGALPMLLITPAFGFGIFFIGLYGEQCGVSNSGLFFTVSAIAMMVIRLASKFYMDRVAPIKLAVTASLFGILAFALLLLCSDIPILFYVAGVPYGLCQALSISVNQSVAVANTPSHRWGATNAFFMLVIDVGMGISSAIWGLVNDSFGFNVTIVCVAVCLALSMLLSRVCYSMIKTQ